MARFYPWQQAQPILEALSGLSYRTGELDRYLQEIAHSVSNLLELDWSVVTVCQDNLKRVMASNIDLGQGEHTYSLHGSLTATVMKTGKTLCIENAANNSEYGFPPEGYASYLGIPLRTSTGEVIGTICSFCIEPRLFTSEEVAVAELFAERAATAIDNYYLYQQQIKFNEVLEAEVAKRTEELRLAQVQLIERERLAAIGEFASMIVHEIRNPVTTIMMGLNHFQKIYTSQRDQMRVALALDEAHRLQNLLQEILLYAKPQQLNIVHNGGEPIPAELVPKLTQPFCSGKPGGTGLGLAIVKRIVEAHDGSLSIQSDALTGTNIVVRIPL